MIEDKEHTVSQEGVTDISSAHARAIALIEGNVHLLEKNSNVLQSQNYFGRNDRYEGPLTISDVLELRGTSL